MNTNTIDKPLSVVMTECKDSIINALNSSKLSPIIMEYLMKDLFEEVHQLAVKQYSDEKNSYESKLQQLEEQAQKTEQPEIVPSEIVEK